MSKVKAKSNPKKRKFWFPTDLLSPIGEFLSEQLKKLERRKNKLEEEDPFTDDARATDNAAVDAEAAEQYGHARISALRKDIDRKIVQIRKALARVKIGNYGICENCGKMIDTDRLMVYPEATLCNKCEKKREK